MPAQQLALPFDRVSVPPVVSLAATAVPAPVSYASTWPVTGALPSAERPLRVARPVDAAIVSSADREHARRQLEQYLRMALGLRVNLTITDNRRNLFSWRRRLDQLTLRLHHMFLSAGHEVKAALASYLGGARQRLQDIRAFIRQNMHHVRPVSLVEPAQARGAHHDLRALFDALNHQYFDDKCSASIAWGKLPPRRRRRRASMRLGSYTLGDAAIRIHPLLDDPRVPAFFVASVVHHEMLHHMVPAAEVGGRMQYHSPEFRRREREFEHFELAVRWEKEHIAELLRR